MRLFLCGDVMTGRGIDQILPHPCPAVLHEDRAGSAMGYLRFAAAFVRGRARWPVRSALGYVTLAERTNGPVPRPVNFDYIWGAALDEWERARPHARIVNLETSITRSDAYEPQGINYRMSPENAGCLTAAGIDVCVLSNNHVLDWGGAGLRETLQTLEQEGFATAGAGRDLAQAQAPAIVDVADKGRLLVLAFATPSSGVPDRWAAGERRPGVNLLPGLDDAAVDEIARRLAEVRKPGDVVVVSIHWGPNWDYEVPEDQRRFARALIDKAGVSVVHGHSSHHAKAVEIYKDRLILYGCGDFLTDYEGIRSRYDSYRCDLTLMYFADVDPDSGRLRALTMTPLQLRKLQLVRPSPDDVEWLRKTLDRESAPFGTRIALTPDGRFSANA